jgi:Lantibiotic biosynthesis dehydratase C-term
MAKIEEVLAHASDPVLTANVYCKDHIDAVLYGALKPFHEEFLQAHPGKWGFWVMRYRRCGEHLKIRLHGDPANISQVKESLSQYLHRTLSGLEWSEGVKQGKVTGAADPVIDQQDQERSDYQPGSVIFTQYNRSHVTFGGSPYLEDSHYAGLFAGVLIAACRYILNNAGLGKQLAHGARATLLAELLEAARDELRLENPAEYFEYHRDWLVRFVLFKAAHTPTEHQKVINAFEKRVDESGEFWRELSARSRKMAAGNPGAFNEWRAALRKLIDYTLSLCDRQQYQIDPFAHHPSHSVLFKALHGASNQLGLALLDEALVHHSVHRAFQSSEAPLATHAG